MQSLADIQNLIEITSHSQNIVHNNVAAFKERKWFEARRKVLQHMLEMYIKHGEFNPQFWQDSFSKWIEVNREINRNCDTTFGEFKSWFTQSHSIYKLVVQALSAAGYSFTWKDEQVTGTREKIEEYTKKVPESMPIFQKHAALRLMNWFNKLDFHVKNISSNEKNLVSMSFDKVCISTRNTSKIVDGISQTQSHPNSDSSSSSSQKSALSTPTNKYFLESNNPKEFCIDTSANFQQKPQPTNGLNQTKTSSTSFSSSNSTSTSTGKKTQKLGVRNRDQDQDEDEDSDYDPLELEPYLKLLKSNESEKIATSSSQKGPTKKPCSSNIARMAEKQQLSSLSASTTQNCTSKEQEFQGGFYLKSDTCVGSTSKSVPIRPGSTTTTQIPPSHEKPLQPSLFSSVPQTIEPVNIRDNGLNSIQKAITRCKELSKRSSTTSKTSRSICESPLFVSSLTTTCTNRQDSILQNNKKKTEISEELVLVNGFENNLRKQQSKPSQQIHQKQQHKHISQNHPGQWLESFCSKIQYNSKSNTSSQPLCTIINRLPNPLNEKLEFIGSMIENNPCGLTQLLEQYDSQSESDLVSIIHLYYLYKKQCENR